jgi:hypothetical protein
MRRACLIRDGHTCTFPGCGASRWLDVHHCIHWLDGGETSMDNAVVLCRTCHTRVHDEGWMIARLPAISEAGSKQQRGNWAESLASNIDDETLALVKALERQLPRYRFYRPANDETSSDKHSHDCCAETQACYAVNLNAPGVHKMNTPGKQNLNYYGIRNLNSANVDRGVYIMAPVENNQSTGGWAGARPDQPTIHV